jgi:flagellar protein FliL
MVCAALYAARGVNPMADAPDDDEATAPEPKKPGTLVPMIVNGLGIFVLALGAVVVGGYINASLHPIPDFKLDAVEGKITAIKPVAVKKSASGGGEGGGEATASLYYAIDPPLVVNFEEGSAVRFLQITMEVMAKDQKAIDGVTRNVPLIRNNLLLLMSNRDYQTLMSREGKEKLRQEALAEVKSSLAKQGAAPIDDLLFTSFVVQ